MPLSLYWLGFVSICGTRIYDGLVGIVGVLPRRVEVDLDSKLVPQYKENRIFPFWCRNGIISKYSGSPLILSEMSASHVFKDADVGWIVDLPR